MNALLLSIGDELLSGALVDTNSAHLSRELARRGLRADAHWTIGDNLDAVAEAFREAAGRADVVVATGGLGPTEDDLTRQGLARAMGADLVLDEGSLAALQEFFRLRQRPMPQANRVQAMIPRGAEALANRVGTAPGIAARIGRANVFAIPGVPAEMKWMFENAVAPRLPRGGGCILERVLHTFGAGESDVGAKIADRMAQRTGPVRVGTTVSAGVVSVRILAHGEDEEHARRQADAAVLDLRRRLGELVFGEGDATLASVTGELLRRAGQTLATAESCTGGLLAEWITSVPGSSDYYLGGVVAYHDRLKREALGVPEELLQSHGAVSEPVAAAMAAGCRQRFGADWALALTGIAGPGGGTATKPVGLLYAALAGKEAVQARRLYFPGDRGTIRLRGALAALNKLRLALLKG